MQLPDYSFLDRLLHQITLGNSYITESSFDLQKISGTEPSDSVIRGKHIFISGLARSGTTVLLREIYSTGKFRSLTYRDMPFVLMPVLWQKFSSKFRRYGEEKERAHGDGVMVNYDSPEAFEEVFWRIFEGKNYIFPEYLKPHDISRRNLKNFQRYVGYILQSSERMDQNAYLSKNNNNILRLPSIRNAFPGSIILIPFRKPLEQANSLKHQHDIFTDKHKRDPFAFKYMKWLSHHEFGMTHLPFVYGEHEFEKLSRFNVNQLEYWLMLWIHTYEYLLDTAPGNAVFISYETLCKDPGRVLKNILQLANIDAELQTNTQIRVMPGKNINVATDSDLEIQAENLYSRLLSKK